VSGQSIGSHASIKSSNLFACAQQRATVALRDLLGLIEHLCGLEVDFVQEIGCHESFTRGIKKQTSDRSAIVQICRVDVLTNGLKKSSKSKKNSSQRTTRERAAEMLQKQRMRKIERKEEW